MPPQQGQQPPVRLLCDRLGRDSSQSGLRVFYMPTGDRVDLQRHPIATVATATAGITAAAEAAAAATALPGLHR